MQIVFSTSLILPLAHGFQNSNMCPPVSSDRTVRYLKLWLSWKNANNVVSESKRGQLKKTCKPGHLTFREIIISSNISQALLSPYYVLGTLLGTWPTWFNPFNPHNNPAQQDHSCPHFTGEKIVAQKHYVTFPKSYNVQVLEAGKIDWKIWCLTHLSVPSRKVAQTKPLSSKAPSKHRIKPSSSVFCHWGRQEAGQLNELPFLSSAHFIPSWRKFWLLLLLLPASESFWATSVHCPTVRAESRHESMHPAEANFFWKATQIRDLGSSFFLGI